MPTTKKVTREEMIARHEDQGYDPFAGKGDDEIERVRTQSRGASPVSIRFSKSLLERLDRIAEQQHRSRSNLIQHVLWSYIRGTPE